MCIRDSAQAGPRGSAIIERWLQRTSLQADYTRRQSMIGEVAHLDEMLKACAGVDVVVLAPDAQPLPGWLQQLSACLSRDASIASATPWSNAGEAAAWPRLGEIAPLPQETERTAAACAPVSYTHLDVYKRQSAPCLPKSWVRWGRWRPKTAPPLPTWWNAMP